MTTPKKRSLIIIAVIILVVAIVLTSFVYLSSQKPYNGAVEPITIGMIPNEAVINLHRTNQQYFINNGLNVTLKNSLQEVQQLAAFKW